LRIRFAGGLSDHSLVVKYHITAAPNRDAHAHPEPKRVGSVVLVDAVDAGLAADIVIGIPPTPTARTKGCGSRIPR
jgi:hypothetical protein